MQKHALAALLVVLLAVTPSCDASSGGGNPLLTVLTPDAALKAAAMMATCVPDDDARQTIASLYYHLDAVPAYDAAVMLCVANKASEGCAAVETCLGARVEVVHTECDMSCDGTVLVECDDNLKFSVDCAKSGRVCVESGGEVSCRASATNTACDWETFEPRCDGGAPVYCSSGLETKGPICADHGTECRVDDGFGAACVGTGAACDAGVFSSSKIRFDQGLRCDGDVLTACVSGGEATRDCAALADGLTCVTKGGESFCGLADECLPTGDLATDSHCDGDELFVCNLGRADAIDCTALGFDGCDATYGVCTPPFLP